MVRKVTEQAVHRGEISAVVDKAALLSGANEAGMR
jgi:hypothetical protein